jgi:hypothetical protein
LLNWFAKLALALGFPWGFILLCLILGLASFGLSLLARRGLLILSYWVISTQRRLGSVPSHLQHDLEFVIHGAPEIYRKILDYLAIALIVWLLAWLARGYITISPFAQLLSFLSSSAEGLYWKLCGVFG